MVPQPWRKAQSGDWRKQRQKRQKVQVRKSQSLSKRLLASQQFLPKGSGISLFLEAHSTTINNKSLIFHYYYLLLPLLDLTTSRSPSAGQPSMVYLITISSRPRQDQRSMSSLPRWLCVACSNYQPTSMNLLSQRYRNLKPYAIMSIES